jgi:triosephosphate isomerase
LFGETDQVVAAKAAKAIEGGLVPVICLGETLDERESGRTMAVVGRQLSAITDILGATGLSSAILAYEPVWAIGTGKTATPEQVQEVHKALRAQVAKLDSACASSLRILYGGSVKASNAAELFSLADVDGALVGGASLVPAEFLAICEAARV